MKHDQGSKQFLASQIKSLLNISVLEAVENETKPFNLFLKAMWMDVTEGPFWKAFLTALMASNDRASAAALAIDLYFSLDGDLKDAKKAFSESINNMVLDPAGRDQIQRTVDAGVTRMVDILREEVKK